MVLSRLVKRVKEAVKRRVPASRNPAASHLGRVCEERSREYWRGVKLDDLIKEYYRIKPHEYYRSEPYERLFEPRSHIFLLPITDFGVDWSYYSTVRRRGPPCRPRLYTTQRRSGLLHRLRLLFRRLASAVLRPFSKAASSIQ
jgi:hypothetical protein